jgi:hypothetical protein
MSFYDYTFGLGIPPQEYLATKYLATFNQRL